MGRRVSPLFISSYVSGSKESFKQLRDVVLTVIRVRKKSMSSTGVADKILGLTFLMMIAYHLTHVRGYNSQICNDYIS